jgi:hypothetical protein
MLAGTTAAGEPDLATPPAPLITDRPDQTESSAVVPPGLVQVEAGGFRVEDREERGTARSHSIGETLIRVGLGRDVELRAGFAGFRVVEEHTPEESDTREDGPGGAALGLKIGVLEERGARPLMALIAGTTLPGGARPFSSDSFDPFLRACASHGLSDRLSLAYNVGAAWQTAEDETGDEDTLSVLLGTVSLGFGATDRVGLFVELFGESGLSAEGALTAADGGATWLVLDNLQLDLSGGVGLSTSASDWFVGLGISFRLPR